MSEPAISASGELLYQRVLPIMQQDEDNGWFGRYLCDALMGMLQGLDQIVLDQTIGGVDYPGWGTIAAPEVCPDDWLPWDAALYGVPLSPGISAEAQRATIEELPPQRRGGVEAMYKAAAPTLIGSGTPEEPEFTITIVERPAGKAYAYVAFTSPEQTAGQEAATKAAILTQKAGGLTLAYSSSSVLHWEDAVLLWEEVAGTVTWANVKPGDA